MTRMILTLVLFASCVVFPATGMTQESLSLQDRVRLENEALRGSEAAARRIALYHGTRNDKLFEYWSWIGAENGDGISQFNYASMLRGKSDAYSKIRAIYWMEKAAQNNVELARDELEKMRNP
ncbi:hypothetical protein E2F46_12375 [Luteimonas aestuarii]|uniref:Sel1 repeat family protein n=1 Tax=Luteimonas aestuarii TaxID=453837 RepID=A0A4R5TMK4_9GAMM|nr:hypothetical protein [Luteimonas aestuarii]TDK23150.1 hypothetical protein E2F46_12375 [Luteimonas aestuarii]